MADRSNTLLIEFSARDGAPRKYAKEFLTISHTVSIGRGLS